LAVATQENLAFYNPAMASKSTLTAEQTGLVDRFADPSFEFLGLTFDQVAQKIVGTRPFANTSNGREFRRQAKLVFNRERPKLDLAYLEWKRRRLAGSQENNLR
jgi:hypothetical protein